MRGARGRALLFSVQRLIGHGATADVIDEYGYTPLMIACWRSDADRKDVILELLRRSSQETRRAVHLHGDRAIDCLVTYAPSTSEVWHERAIAELLCAGAPAKPENAPRLLPILVSLMQRQDDELAWFALGKHWDWRGHDEVVGLVYDLRHMEEDLAEEAMMRACLEKVKAELRARGQSVVDEPGERQSGGSGGDGGGVEEKVEREVEPGQEEEEEKKETAKKKNNKKKKKGGKK